MTEMIVDHTDAGAAFRRLSLPLAVTMLGDQLLGIVDTIAIGSMGTVALAGVTAAAAVFVAAIYGISGFSSGLSIVAAQRIGAHDVDGFARSVRAGAIVPMLCAIACALLSIPLSLPIVHAMVGPLASVKASAQYLTVRCFSLIPIVVSGTLIAGLGAAGNRKMGVYVLALINLVHIPLLLVLALGWGTHHPLGIVGAGISSLTSEAIAAAYALIYAARRPIYRIFERARNIEWKLALEIARLGLPEAIFLIAVVLPDTLMIAMLAQFGPTVISALRALNIVSDLTFVVPSPLQAATQTVIGQRLGARDIEGARHFFYRARRLSFWIAGSMGLVIAVFAWPLAYVFTLNAEVATLAALPLALHMTALPIKGWAMVSLAPIRASGDTRFSMFVGLLCGALVLPIAWICINRLHVELYAVPIAWIAAWLARAALTQWKLHGDSWTRGALAV
ncbi:MAG: MATE family efflux transporter [Vulcanimicrobiaceae bacterium]